MTYRYGRDADYSLVRDRKLRRNRLHYDDDIIDGDDDDYHWQGSRIDRSRRYVRGRPIAEYPGKYYSHDDVDYGYRSRFIDPADVC
jgi:hypothetical protein